MILRSLRKRIALLLSDRRHRNDPAARARARRQIGARYRRKAHRDVKPVIGEQTSPTVRVTINVPEEKK